VKYEFSRDEVGEMIEHEAHCAPLAMPQNVNPPRELRQTLPSTGRQPTI